jgi:hypothetical protein
MSKVYKYQKLRRNNSNVKSASKKTDEMLNAAKKPLEQYLLAAGLNVKVNFYSSKDKFDIASMDRKDGVAVVSNTKKKTVDYIMKNFDGKGFMSARYKYDLAEYAKADWSSYPEVSDANEGWGYVIAVTVDPTKDWMKKEYNLSNPEFTAFMILHGMGHLSGILHGGGQDNPPDLGFMTEGPLLDKIMKRYKGDMVGLIKNTVSNYEKTMAPIWKRWNE